MPCRGLSTISAHALPFATQARRTKLVHRAQAHDAAICFLYTLAGCFPRHSGRFLWGAARGDRPPRRLQLLQTGLWSTMASHIRSPSHPTSRSSSCSCYGVCPHSLTVDILMTVTIYLAMMGLVVVCWHFMPNFSLATFLGKASHHDSKFRALYFGFWILDVGSRFHALL